MSEFKPVRLILQGDKELAATHKGDANRILFQLKNLQDAGGFTQRAAKQYQDGTVIECRTDVKGMDIVKITSGFRVASDKEEKYREYTNKYIVPVIYGYSYIATTNAERYNKNKPEIFALMKDLDFFVYKYNPSNLDEISDEISEQYDMAGLEDYYVFCFGSADKNYFSPGKSIEIKELYSITENTYDPDKSYIDIVVNNSNPDESYVYTPYDPGDYCPQIDNCSITFDSLIDTHISVFGSSTHSKSMSEHSEASLVWPHALPTPSCPYGTFGTWYVINETTKVNINGERINNVSSVCIDTEIPSDGKRNFSSIEDAYLYFYTYYKYAFNESPWGPFHDTMYNDVDFVFNCSLDVYSKNNSTGKKYTKSIDIFSITGTVNTTYAWITIVDSNIFDFYGEPVFLLSYIPYATDNGVYRTDGNLNKIAYLMIYNDMVYECKNKFEIINSDSKAHIVTDSNGNTISDENGNTYYSSGCMRLVEVTETIREKI